MYVGGRSLEPESAEQQTLRGGGFGVWHVAVLWFRPPALGSHCVASTVLAAVGVASDRRRLAVGDVPRLPFESFARKPLPQSGLVPVTDVFRLSAWTPCLPRTLSPSLGLRTVPVGGVTQQRPAPAGREAEGCVQRP